MDHVKIPTPLFNALMEYLSTRPIREAGGVYSELLRAKSPSAPRLLKNMKAAGTEEKE